ncbi:MFS transporter [Bacillus massiliigorillae]|uniref:MFS transporter n=1 Tax=Bacillus massiliigorillae TaxID=1243664 RepID=UPI00039B171B|nr:MFS transporter [Bacillus massiliigorillae]
MGSSISNIQPNTISKQANQTAYKFLFIMGFCHLLNDTLQAVVPAMFPILEKELLLSYTQLGLIAFSLNMVSSVMQPIVGWYTDSRPMPYALPIAMLSTMIGMILLATAPSYNMIIVSVILIGIGSAIFHPEGSRVVHMAAGSKKGLAQSIYQVGGNGGQALAPLITALILLPIGQIAGLTFAPLALLASLLLFYIARWYAKQIKLFPKAKKKAGDSKKLSSRVWTALGIILFLIFARSWYISAMTNFFAFYMMKQYDFSAGRAQIFIFVFLLAGACGTFFGGPLADRFGKKTIIVISMLASAPLTAILPFVPSYIALLLLLIIGFILMSSFSVTVVYAQELVPGKVGTMAGLTVGLAFGMGAIGSIVIGSMADNMGLVATIQLMGFLPLLGCLSFLLPSDQSLRTKTN